ncbi:polyketide cyclase [Clostridioides difficile]|nr:polyketide cyclase [Clostridioides difficile]
MEFSFMTKVNAKKEKVWEYYADIQKWYAWESDLKNITLDNGFITGSSGIMELEGMPPMEYLLTSVKENQEFWDKTDTPMGSIYFGHEIFENKDNSISIKHTVRLESDIINEEKVNFLKQVFSDVPDSIMLLKEKVEL